MNEEGSHASYSDDVPSSPDAEYGGRRGAECGVWTSGDTIPSARTKKGPNAIYPSKDAVVDDDDLDLDEMYHIEEVGEEDYILGSLMVRILQGKHLWLNPNSRGIGGFLSKHRRIRHAKTSASPASGGSLTPSAYSQQVYARIEFKRQVQMSGTAVEHTNGDYQWSRGDSTYFDVTCPSYAHLSGQHKTTKAAPSSPKKPCSDATEQEQKQMRNLIELKFYAKTGSTNKRGGKTKQLPDDYFIGQASIQVTPILSGKIPYFDEYCTLYNGSDIAAQSEAGRVRVILEYEPLDPPPRPGDVCCFANVSQAIELYPIPHRTISNTVRPVASSTSMSTLSTKSSSSTASSQSSVTTTVTSQPKTYRVEEVVGDHVVLSYESPERWLCTFEVHRYLLLTVERHQAVVEKAKEHVLDFVDNISQSPMIESLAHTIDKIPDEGLVYVSADVVEGGIGLAGKWWESGIQGAVEDIVNAANLDGRYCHYSISDEEEEEESFGDEEGTEEPQRRVKTYQNSEDDAAEPLPGMPNCPITGTPMIHPVVAADGHTYERSAIARWLETSDRSPLTGQRMAHSNLAPNYLLLSSFESHEL
ncbi:hypothetical protein THAOC_37517 [Thalassiosira oceanica]|uniref:U-box domain-containing protein n=1 Tax=Thalassiosira oceanica TaxID=159749 RepID=K0RBR6_THAOC|nr:hypothetical protein THAOC_37517 [Thalassiosira oceanica]|eukprot:EJK43987.1 hypothetical protein THAOC_37517 [Thalassiosira oceanica]